MCSCFSFKKEDGKVPYSQFDKDIGKKPLCYFRGNCTRKNPKHHDEFSHDELNYNGVCASKAESRKEYRNDVPVQSCLGGGHARVAAHHPPSSHSSESGVKNAGLAIITCDVFLVFVRENEGTWNFPSGKREQYETSLDSAIRETGEELGIQTNPGVLKVFRSGLLDNQWTYVRTHRDSSKTNIYVFNHSESSAWFNANFCSNSECSDIRMMSIPEFISNVERSPTVFRFPDSMIQFAIQLKGRMPI
jgi:8-oxo-dGTP pyrophosphatase MutT (NUDIX family)